MKVKYSYLPRQFAEIDDLLKDIKKFVKTGDFTLGKPLDQFEKRFAKLMGSKYAIGVNSGTDAIKLSLKAFGIGSGDEVITAANTFVATVGAIIELGAKPVFVDCDDTFCMNVDLVEKAITEKTKAIVPVHFTGYMTNMKKINKIANKHKLVVVEDACQSILASQDGKIAGNWGATGCFSLHPLKNLNVWGDGGFIITNNKSLAKRLYLIRNHGLVNRDNCSVFAYNSRLDTIQAVVANYKLKTKLNNITKKRIENAHLFDRYLKGIPQIKLVERNKNIFEVFHLYQINVKKRNELKKYLNDKNVDAKIHYPIPIHLQKAAKFLNHKKKDFPVAEEIAKTTLSLPVHEFITNKDVKYVATLIKKFFKKK